MTSLDQLDIFRCLMDTSHSLCCKKCWSKFGKAIEEGLINEFINVDLPLYIKDILVCEHRTYSFLKSLPLGVYSSKTQSNKNNNIGCKFDSLSSAISFLFT